MWRQAAVGLLGVYLVSTVALFPQSRGAMILAISGGVLAIGFAAASPIWPNALNWAAAAGFLLGMSAFIVTENPLTDGDRGTIGVFILACAVAPSPRISLSGKSEH